MGVTFAKPDKGDRILLVTTGPESEIDEYEAEKPVLEDSGEAVNDAQGDALGSDESEPSTDDADHDEE